MSVSLITESPWQALRNALTRTKVVSHVAVAFLGQSGSKMLNGMRPNSKLLVDASEGTVKKGLTCPEELLKLHAKGVRIFSAPHLHSKVFVIGKSLFVGSCNVSNNSETVLQEAMLKTTDPIAIKQAKQFVAANCSIRNELGPKALTLLAKKWRRPKDGDGKLKKTSRAKSAELVRVVRLTLEDYPKESEAAYKDGLAEARRNRALPRSTHFLDDFRSRQGSIHVGNTIVQVTTDDDGIERVSPPGKVIACRDWSNGHQKCRFIYLELPNKRRRRLKRCKKYMSQKAFNRLLRGGIISKVLANEILNIWD